MIYGAVCVQTTSFEVMKQNVCFCKTFQCLLKGTIFIVLHAEKWRQICSACWYPCGQNLGGIQKLTVDNSYFKCIQMPTWIYSIIDEPSPWEPYTLQGGSPKLGQDFDWGCDLEKPRIGLFETLYTHFLYGFLMLKNTEWIFQKFSRALDFGKKYNSLGKTVQITWKTFETFKI